MSRQEIQIVDLEPSVIGEDVTRYAIQVRGVDSNGNEGPWSSILEYESPELLPSLESNNYIEGVSGWRLDNDGTFEVNDGLIRGTLQSANYVPNTSGWALDVNGNVEFSTGTFRGALRIGQNTFNVDSGGNLFIGGSTFATSPFAVNTNGQIAAMSINGSFIQANTIAADRIVANSIGAGQIATNYVYAGTIDAQQINAGFLNVDRLQVNSINGDRVLDGSIGNVKIASISAAKITAGTLGANVVYAGAISADQISGGTISGINITGSNISATGLTVSTNISATGLNASGGTFFGASMTAGSSTFLGQLTSALVGGSPVISTISTTTDSHNLFIKVAAPNNGRIVRFTSSAKYKKDIVDAPLYDIKNLRPVLFRSILPSDGDGLQLGLIAEEVAELDIPGLATYSNGNPDGVTMALVGVVLVQHVKNLYDRIEQLEEQLNGS